MSSPVAIPSIIPAPYKIGWRQWVDSGGLDARGNRAGSLSAARTMPAQGFYQAGSQQPVSAEYASRQVQELVVMVPNADVYGKRDVILLGGAPQLDGSYTGGRAFAMDGHPEDYISGSPFVEINGVFGAELHLKRTG